MELVYDGIVGRDFLQHTRAKVCYGSNTVTFKTESEEWTKEILGNKIIRGAMKTLPERSEMTVKLPVEDGTGGQKGIKEIAQGTTKVRKLILPGRVEVIVKLPIENGIDGQEGIIDKSEIADGVYLASSLARVSGNHVVTSVLNTNETEIILDMPVVKLEKYDAEKFRKGDSREYMGTLAAVRKEKTRNRIGEVLEKLRLDHLNPEEKEMIEKTCRDYHDIFHLPGDKLNCTNAIKHSINVIPGTSPVNTRPYRLPEAQKAEIDKQIDKLLRKGVIEESNSPWNSPLLVVPKKDDASGEKKWRLVVDFRKLNERTVGDAYPLPDITEILDQLGKSKYFSCLDMVMGYHQIELREEDKEKTAFSTKGGHWSYKRLPFGIKTAPSTFQRMINNVLCGLTGTRCFVFLDDIVIYAKSLSEHDDKLRDVFGRIRKYNLKLQPDKCEFLRTEVSYLGHVITEDGVRPDPKKVEVIENFPRPTSTKQLKSFLGMASYYRKFISKFSKIAAPLYMLLKKDAHFEWLDDQENAFQGLKQKLMSQPILQYPDFAREFILTTDASNEGIGAVLSQGQIGKDLPIAYASRNLNKAEKNYSTSEKELLAIVWGIKHFRPSLYGRKFKIASDHKPLTWIMNIKDPGSRLLRWRIKLEEYDYEIIYKKGTSNTNADALSRISKIVVENKGQPQLEISDELKRQILYEYDDAPLGGHRGMNKTYTAIKNKYSWPNMKQEIEEYVRKCKSCQVNKVLGPQRKVPMEITTTANQPFEKRCLDIVGPLPETQKENKYILTFQDELSKFLVAIPIPRQDSETVAQEFVTHVVLKLGTPSKILTDQGSNFLSEVFKNTCKMLKIKKLQTTPFQPESNGGLERSHRIQKEYLRHYIGEDQSNWDVWVPCTTLLYTHPRGTHPSSSCTVLNPAYHQRYKRTLVFNIITMIFWLN
jgi:hypothetical protein